jgi:hypothetical protein
MRLPVAIELRSGTVIREFVEVRDSDSSFNLRINGHPDRLILDPDAVMPIAPSKNGNGHADPFTVEVQ